MANITIAYRGISKRLYSHFIGDHRHRRKGERQLILPPVNETGFFSHRIYRR